MSVVPRLRDPALDIRKKFLNLEFYKYWNGFTAPGLLWGEWNTCLRMQNLRIPITSVIEVSTIFKYRNKCKISTMNNTSKFYIKTGSNGSGIWVEEVKILFTSTADVLSTTSPYILCHSPLFWAPLILTLFYITCPFCFPKCLQWNLLEWDFKYFFLLIGLEK